ncbi:hypothetical protein Mic7113_1518 [Allocoleopsis franciscana PCC 7113]|uniref:Uncharacterized protein n=1 Tax=Allocoleopsis franciscana PCC 7113 TaxID=1173027 RepID=K9WCA2_9CYAN|nr:hypothetical protein Mic7113_1518 [Allocoleopsis franciscana PCC 7113]
MIPPIFIGGNLQKKFIIEFSDLIESLDRNLNKIKQLKLINSFQILLIPYWLPRQNLPLK